MPNPFRRSCTNPVDAPVGPAVICSSCRRDDFRLYPSNTVFISIPANCAYAAGSIRARHLSGRGLPVSSPCGLTPGYCLALCGLAFLTGGGLAIFHTGVERHWWLGTSGLRDQTAAWHFGRGFAHPAAAYGSRALRPDFMDVPRPQHGPITIFRFRWRFPASLLWRRRKARP